MNYSYIFKEEKIIKTNKVQPLGCTLFQSNLILILFKHFGRKDFIVHNLLCVFFSPFLLQEVI